VKFVPREPLAYVAVAAVEPVVQPANGSLQSGGPPRVIGIYASHDAAALYLDLFLDPTAKREIDWSRDRYVIALNTCDAPCGAEQLPVPGGIRLAEGANFVVELQGPPASRLLVADNYDPWQEVAVAPTGSREFRVVRDMTIALASDARFEHEIVETNVLRFARDGTRFPRINADRSFLRYGNFEVGAQDYSSLGQWYYDPPRARLRLRLSWGLLLALDPSQGLVFWGTDNKGIPAGKVSHSIRLVLLSYAAPDDKEAGTVAQIMAASDSGNVLIKGWGIPWPTWGSVKYQPTFKKSYHELSKAFPELTGYATGGGDPQD